ncbi:ABC transporter permease [Alkaliphilus serpentinus]|uniref:ABC transporter permease n=1 Tax=Alkaliphilus serpentinus TaxID=1482731 RepID=A0A833M8E0_9FIRM|nr:ABC transporter permease [Alkaliphilus serpentinus]KAB3525511.1 ABC transporter permease [Alkaliphilus serpentinus]
MYLKIIKNDILRRKGITLITMLFVATAAMLVSLAAILMVNLTGSIDTLMTKAKTPHFMQMHSGVIDINRLTVFAEENGNVDDFQVLEFLNVDGDSIIFDKGSLRGNLQDNGLSVQSKNFDFLLDLEGNIIKVDDGEIYIPICYMKDNTTKVGEKVVILGKEFTIAGFLRDSQMNSSLSSSKRFLISQKDYNEIKSHGTNEYLIQFRLKDMSGIGAFETAYASAGLEGNGPTITYRLFKLINAVSDGLMIAVILLISFLIVAIAFMCIRFTLLAKIEDDYREIGVMKAIGLRISDIKRIYIAKYAAIGGVGCTLGFTLSLLFRGLLLENIKLFMGEGENSYLALPFGIVGVLLVFFAIILHVRRVLKPFSKISATEAIRFGTSQDKTAVTKGFSLWRNRFFNTNVFLGIKDVLVRKGLYTTMLLVLILSVFIIIVPQNLYTTISSKSFITYRGIGSSHIRIDIQQTDNISHKAAKLIESIKGDKDFSKHAVLITKTFQIKTEEGLEESIKIELGDHSIFPVEYSQGTVPIAEDEIALSSINAEELGKEVGDVMTILIDGMEKNLIVRGIYSDITNGGKTAKAVLKDHSDNIMWYVIYGELHDKSLASGKVNEYAEAFKFAKVSEIDEYITQTFGSTMSSVEKASYAAIIIALMITILVTLLFMKMLIAKDRYSIAVMKALGFSNRDISLQYLSRSGLVLTVGVALGILMANTLGETLAGMVISGFGASSFQFEVNPFSAYILCPLLMIVSVMITTMIATSVARQIKITESIKE